MSESHEDILASFQVKYIYVECFVLNRLIYDFNFLRLCCLAMTDKFSFSLFVKHNNNCCFAICRVLLESIFPKQSCIWNKLIGICWYVNIIQKKILLFQNICVLAFTYSVKILITKITALGSRLFQLIPMPKHRLQ